MALTIDDLLSRSRSGLERITARDVEAATRAGALLVDMRPVEQRGRDGAMPGALVIDRNVLEWRLAPSSDHRIPEATDGRRVILVCDQGYSSSLAADTLRQLGVDATDLVGGFRAWRAWRDGERDDPDDAADEKG